MIGLECVDCADIHRVRMSGRVNEIDNVCVWVYLPRSMSMWKRERERERERGDQEEEASHFSRIRYINAILST